MARTPGRILDSVTVMRSGCFLVLPNRLSSTLLSVATFLYIDKVEHSSAGAAHSPQRDGSTTPSMPAQREAARDGARSSSLQHARL